MSGQSDKEHTKTGLKGANMTHVKLAVLAAKAYAKSKPYEIAVASLVGLVTLTAFFALAGTSGGSHEDEKSDLIHITYVDRKGMPEGEKTIKKPGTEKIKTPEEDHKTAAVAKNIAPDEPEGKGNAIPSDGDKNPSEAVTDPLKSIPDITPSKEDVITADPAVPAAWRKAYQPPPGYTDGLDTPVVPAGNTTLTRQPVSQSDAISGQDSTFPLSDTRDAAQAILKALLDRGIPGEELQKLLTGQDGKPHSYNGKSLTVKYDAQNPVTVYVYSTLSSKVFLLPIRNGQPPQAYLSDEQGWSVTFLPGDILRVQRRPSAISQATDLFLVAGEHTYSLILQSVSDPEQRTDTLRFTENNSNLKKAGESPEQAEPAGLADSLFKENPDTEMLNNEDQKPSVHQ